MCTVCATAISAISVYYFSSSRVYYFIIFTLLTYVYCLWPLPYLLLVYTTLVLFVRPTFVFLHYLHMCTVCGLWQSTN